MTTTSRLSALCLGSQLFACAADGHPDLFQPIESGAEVSRPDSAQDPRPDAPDDAPRQPDNNSDEGRADTAPQDDADAARDSAMADSALDSIMADAALDSTTADSALDGTMADGALDARADALADGATCHRPPADAGPAPLENPAATIRDVVLSGDLCPPGTEVVAVSGDAQAVTVVFSVGLLGDHPPTAAACSVTIELEEPAGYHMGAPDIQWRGTGAATTLVRGYGYEGGPTSRAFSDEVSGDFSYEDRPNLWSPSCSTPGRVRFHATIVPVIHVAGELFTLYSLDVDTAWRSGVDWRRTCQDPALVVAPPAGAGDWCGGRHVRPCACGLACEYDLVATSDKEGVCVDPAEAQPAGNLAEKCGGLRHIGCSDGLVCWEPSQAAIDQGWLGRCAAAAGGVDATCQSGIPSLGCLPNLSCALESHRCVEANGQLLSPCGDGLPSCIEPLRCNGTQCVAPRAP